MIRMYNVMSPLVSTDTPNSVKTRISVLEIPGNYRLFVFSISRFYQQNPIIVHGERSLVATIRPISQKNLLLQFFLAFT